MCMYVYQSACMVHGTEGETGLGLQTGSRRKTTKDKPKPIFQKFAKRTNQKKVTENYEHVSLEYRPLLFCFFRSRNCIIQRFLNTFLDMLCSLLLSVGLDLSTALPSNPCLHDHTSLQLFCYDEREHLREDMRGYARIQESMRFSFVLPFLFNCI